jgi:hypothetical protein
MNRKKWLIGVLIIASAISALFDGLFYLRGMDSTSLTGDIAGVLSARRLVLWIDADSRNHPQIGRPFDFGFFLMIFWLPYLPYYLWRTRGVAGLWLFTGFVALLSLGFLVQVAILLVLATNQQFFAVPR